MLVLTLDIISTPDTPDRSFQIGHSCGWRKDTDVLIRGSFPGPLARFSRRAVDEKFDVEAGVLVETHCVAGVRKMAAAALSGRKTGRKCERLIAWVTVAQLQRL